MQLLYICQCLYVKFWQIIYERKKYHDLLNVIFKSNKQKLSLKEKRFFPSSLISCWQITRSSASAIFWKEEKTDINNEMAVVFSCIALSYKHEKERINFILILFGYQIIQQQNEIISNPTFLSLNHLFQIVYFNLYFKVNLFIFNFLET